VYLSYEGWPGNYRAIRNCCCENSKDFNDWCEESTTGGVVIERVIAKSVTNHTCVAARDQVANASCASENYWRVNDSRVRCWRNANTGIYTCQKECCVQLAWAAEECGDDCQTGLNLDQNERVGYGPTEQSCETSKGTKCTCTETPKDTIACTALKASRNMNLWVGGVATEVWDGPCQSGMGEFLSAWGGVYSYKGVYSCGCWAPPPKPYYPPLSNCSYCAGMCGEGHLVALSEGHACPEQAPGGNLDARVCGHQKCCYDALRNKSYGEADCICGSLLT
jgi:hypothetical protein